MSKQSTNLELEFDWFRGGLWIRRRAKSISTRALVAATLTASAALCGEVFAQEQPAATEKITFADHVKPILAQRCSSCHNGQRREGDLDVTNFTNLMQGGGSGVVIEAQDAGSSYLYKLITHEDSPEMPPSGTKIPEAEIAMIGKWIDMGALESKSSTAPKPKVKIDMSLSGSPLVRPEVLPVPLRMPLEPVIEPARASVLAIATSPWAPIAAVSTPKQILLYNTDQMALAGVLPLTGEVAHSLRFSRDGKYLLSGGGRDGASGRATLWNVITGAQVTTVGDELESVLAADVNPSLTQIAFGGPNKLLKIVRVDDGSVMYEISKHTDWVTAVAFSPDGKYLASGDRNGGLHVWEADTGSEVYTLAGHSKAITGISWRTDSRVVASASEDTTVKGWNIDNGAQLKSWAAHGEGVTAIEFTRDGNLATAGRDQKAKLWDGQGKLIRELTGLSDVAVAVSVCDETQRVLAADWKGQLRVWNAADGAELGSLVANPPRLERRVAAAATALEQAQQTQMPLVEAVNQLQTALNGIAANLQQTKAAQEATQVKLAETETEFTSAKAQFESTAAQHAQWRSELDQKNLAQPAISKALEDSAAAAALLPDDPEMKQAVATLDAKLKQVSARVGELNGLVAKSVEEKATSKARMDELAGSLAATKAEMTALTSQVVKLESEFGQMDEKLKSEAAVAEAAKQEVERAAGELARWQGEIDFVAQLKSFGEQLAQSEQEVSAKQAIVDAAEQKLAEAERLVAEANAAKAAAETQTQAVKAKMLELRGGK